jgi:hypothetical protein
VLLVGVASASAAETTSEIATASTRDQGIIFALHLGERAAREPGVALAFTPFTRFESCSTPTAAALALATIAPGAPGAPGAPVARTLGARHVEETREAIAVQRLEKPNDRATAFHALTAAFLTLSVLDSYTTSVALKHGLQEKNPVIAPIAADSTALYITKAALAVTTIIAAKQVWTVNRVAGIVTMVAANAVSSFVVMHNARLIQAAR